MDCSFSDNSILILIIIIVIAIVLWLIYSKCGQGKNGRGITGSYCNYNDMIDEVNGGGFFSNLIKSKNINSSPNNISSSNNILLEINKIDDLINSYKSNSINITDMKDISKVKEVKNKLDEIYKSFENLENSIIYHKKISESNIIHYNHILSFINNDYKRQINSSRNPLYRIINGSDVNLEYINKEIDDIKSILNRLSNELNSMKNINKLIQ